MSDIARVPEGLRVTIRRLKGDQEGRGATIAVPAGRRLKPVQHLDTWLERAAVADGPLFRRLSQCGTRVLADRMSDRSVAEIVKARAKVAGLDPKSFAGHSLRAGFLTSAARGLGVGLEDAGAEPPQEPELLVRLRPLRPAVRGPHRERLRIGAALTISDWVSFNFSEAVEDCSEDCRHVSGVRGHCKCLRGRERAADSGEGTGEGNDRLGMSTGVSGQDESASG